MFVFVCNSRWVACVQDPMPTAIMVCSTTSANQTASATTGFSTATLQHLLITVLAIAGVMVIGAGRLLLFGSGFSIAPHARQPFTNDFVYSDGSALGKRELGWQLPPLRFVTIPVARRFCTAHSSAVFPRQGSVPAAAA